MKTLYHLATAGLALALGTGVAMAQSSPYGQSQSSRSQTSTQKHTSWSTSKTTHTSMTTGGSVEFYVGPMAIQQVQQKLSAAGLTPGTSDGSWSDETRSAVRQFQQQRGIPATGDLDLQTLSMLGVDLNQAETQSPSSRYGTQGKESNQGGMGNMGNMGSMDNPGESGSQGDQGNMGNMGSMGSMGSQSSTESSSTESSSMGSQTSMTTPSEGTPLFAGPSVMQQVIQKLSQQRYGSSKSSKNSGTNTGSMSTLSATSTPTEVSQVLTEFQRAKHLPATGELTFETLHKLGIDLNSFTNSGRYGRGTTGTTGQTGTSYNNETSANMPIYVGNSIVRRVQEALDKSGHSVGRTDGEWGPETRTGIQDFQRAKGLPVTGNINLEVLHTLNVASTLNNLSRM